MTFAWMLFVLIINNANPMKRKRKLMNEENKTLCSQRYWDIIHTS